ncbi:MAG: DUF5615 family PIN-like protein [Anaerolineae bacterium]|nr:DUF5615 family PIN-like protein [Anaerolineae bacterium]
MTGQHLKLLLDEHIWEGLAETLNQRGYDVIHLNHTTQRGIDDEPLLAYAAAEGRAVLTYNSRDFVPLVRLWFEADQEHAGVILSVQLPQGDLLRQTEKLLSTLTANEMKNTVRWLQEFK